VVAAVWQLSPRTCGRQASRIRSPSGKRGARGCHLVELLSSMSAVRIFILATVGRTGEAAAAPCSLYPSHSVQGVLAAESASGFGHAHRPWDVVQKALTERL